jgi:ketosteroid isomerase-like protein
MAGRRSARTLWTKVSRATTEITVERLIEDQNVIVAEGTVRTRRTDNTVIDLAFCDVFEMRAGKIGRLTSYLVQLG